MKIIYFWGIIGLLGVGGFCFAQSLSSRDQLFASAAEAYDRGDFVEAAKDYERIVASGWRSPALFYNLGNSYFKNGELGQAILNYRKAQDMAPRDPEVNKNLQYAREALEDDLSSVSMGIWARGRQALIHLLPLSGWALLVLIIYWLVVLAILIAIFSPSFRPLTRTFLKFSIPLLLATGIVFWQAGRESQVVRAVVLVPQLEACYSPGLDQTEAFVLHEGTEVRVVRFDANPSWVQIALPDGTSGWVPATGIGVI